MTLQNGASCISCRDNEDLVRIYFTECSIARQPSYIRTFHNILDYGNFEKAIYVDVIRARAKSQNISGVDASMGAIRKSVRHMQIF